MKKFALPLLLASIVLGSPAVAQESSVSDQTQKSYNILVSQYATASLGFYIEQRCRQLAESAYLDFAANQQLLNSFMLIMMGKDTNTNLLNDIKNTASNAELNPCDKDTFRFALSSSTIASQLATRVKLLSEEEVAQLTAAMTGPAGAVPQQTQSQPPVQTENQPVYSEPEPQPQAQTQQPQSEDVDTIEYVPTTVIDRQPEGKKPPSQTQSSPTTQPPASQSQPAAQTASVPAGITLANYVNPYPYAAIAPPPGETEKDMKRRHRQEIIDLRRAHRAEMDAFKDNEDRYANPDEIKNFIQNRQDDEFDQMRNRHQQELDRF